MEDEEKVAPSSRFDPISWARKVQMESADNDSFGQVNRQSSSSSSYGFDRNQSWNNNVQDYDRQQTQSQSSTQRNYLTQLEKVRLLQRLTSKFLPKEVFIPILDISSTMPSQAGPVLMTGLEKRYNYNQGTIMSAVTAWRAPLMDIHEDKMPDKATKFLTVAPSIDRMSIKSDTSTDDKMSTCRADSTNQLMELVANRVIPIVMSPKKGLTTMYIGSLRLELYRVDDVTLSMSTESSQQLYTWLRERMGHARSQSQTVWRYVFNLRLSVTKPDQGYNITVVVDADKEQITFYDPIGDSNVKTFLKDTIQPTLIKNLTDLLRKPSPLLLDGKINLNGLLLPFSQDYCFSMSPMIFILECFLGDSDRVSHCFNHPLEKSKAYERYFVENIQKLNLQLNSQLRDLSTCGSGDDHAGLLSCDVSGVKTIVSSIFKLVGVNAALVY
jgi:hypothetical protein